MSEKSPEVNSQPDMAISTVKAKPFSDMSLFYYGNCDCGRYVLSFFFSHGVSKFLETIIMLSKVKVTPNTEMCIYASLYIMPHKPFIYFYRRHFVLSRFIL